ncbi:hypothetical protein CDD83_6592 [Cordyceps sp. RAO-2017]|nr:hypothetical protein CDD83_6592 [Cordyceps sp. RAO-2017]
MSPTVTVKPVHVAPMGAMPEQLYMIPEHPMPNHHHQPSLGGPTRGRPSTAGSAPPSYPTYPRLQAPMLDRHKTADSFPVTLKRPKKLSRNSTGQSRESLALATESPPWARMTIYEPSDPAGWRPIYAQPTRPPPPIKGLRSRTRPQATMASLPGEVLEVVAEMLKELHLGAKSESCATCWMRDLCSLSLCCRQWSRVARRALYEDVRLDGPDSPARKRKLKAAHGSRMTLLRQTLRANPDLAGLVRSLKVPRMDIFVETSSAKEKAAREQYEELVSALVMACPNLERLAGPVLSHGDGFKTLLHALATRSNLRDMAWLVEPPCSAAGRQCADDDAPSSSGRGGQTETALVEQHRNWKRLRSLSMHCAPGATLAADRLLAATVAVLPALQQLHLSGLPAEAFDDADLLSLPRLRTLSLSATPGISSGGLSSFATRPNSRSLRSLQLRHTPLTSLPALARILPRRR